MAEHYGLIRPESYEVETTEFGRLVWMVSKRLDNSDTMTVGQCHITPGRANPRHYHPNCDEILHVLQGEIEHTLGDEVFRMAAGDTVSIPAHTYHNARNVGTVDAVLQIAFSAADRQTVGE
jgi:quercetin dioxygenase-like cupin family protein